MDGGRKGEDQSTYNKHCRSYGHFNAGKIEMQTILTDSFFFYGFRSKSQNALHPQDVFELVTMQQDWESVEEGDGKIWGQLVRGRKTEMGNEGVLGVQTRKD